MILLSAGRGSDVTPAPAHENGLGRRAGQAPRAITRPATSTAPRPRATVRTPRARSPAAAAPQPGPPSGGPPPGPRRDRSRRGPGGGPPDGGPGCGAAAAGDRARGVRTVARGRGAVDVAGRVIARGA